MKIKHKGQWLDATLETKGLYMVKDPSTGKEFIIDDPEMVIPDFCPAFVTFDNMNFPVLNETAKEILSNIVSEYATYGHNALLEMNFPNGVITIKTK